MTTHDTNNLTLVQRMAVALTSLDEQELRDITTEDVFWAVPGTGRFAGRKQGISAIMAFAKVLRDYGVHPAVEETCLGTDSVAVLIHDTGTRGDAVLDSHSVFTLKQNVFLCR